MNDSELRTEYERLYKETTYGKAAKDACPGVRYFNYYRPYLRAPVIDLGCGSGDTVYLLRSKGFTADGIDWVKLDNEMLVRDLREPIDLSGYRTALCMDVLEHLEEPVIFQLLRCMARCRTQIVSIHTGSSKTDAGVELHLTQRPFTWWDYVIDTYLGYCKRVVTQKDVRAIYLAGAF